MNRKEKMVVFDMDNTLLQGRFIDECASNYNFSQALELLRYIHPPDLSDKIASFLTGKVKEELIRIVSGIRLVPGTEDVITELKQRGYVIGIISDSYNIITEHVAKRIRADFFLSNELEFNGDIANGRVLVPGYFSRTSNSLCDHPVCKTNALTHICSKYRVPLSNTIVIGDSDVDACMVKHAGTGVSFCTNSKLLKSAAVKHINDCSFSEVLSFAN